MRVYKYKNATVYITNPTEVHLKKIRNATEIFLKRVVKERVQNGDRKNHRRVTNYNPDTRKRA